MPKQPTFENIYPTLRKPLSLQKKSKYTVTLRERNNLSSSSISNVIPNMDSIMTPTIASNSDFINDIHEKIRIPSTLLHNAHTIDHNNINDSNIQYNLIRSTEGDLQDNICLDNPSFPLLRPNSPSTSSTSLSNSEDDDADSENNFTAGHKNYYDVNSELPGYTGDGSPYFPGFTAMWMFIWFTKNSIHAYHELVKIIRHPKFKADQIPYSITTLKKFYKGLPLLPFTGKFVKIDMKNTPTNTLPLKEAYIYLIKDHIYQKNTEIWHGNLWKESPLFGETSLIINNVTYKTGDWIEYRYLQDQLTINRIGRITGVVTTNESPTRKFHELSGILKSNERRQRSQLYNELWLEESRNTISVQDIIRNTNVWITDDTPCLLTYEFSIQEIIYTFNGHQKVCHISLRHKLPVKYIVSPQSPPHQNIKHLKFFIDLYYNDFGAFNKAYHKLEGIYVQIGNMNHELRKKLRNHFLISFVPFGGEFDDVIEDFIADMKELQSGILMPTKDGQVWVTAGFGMATADLPQGNYLAGVKRHNAE
ncbi:hypothetical protein RhiirC2_787785 [Rhizophagus irregularis]|uniref:Uncharacterized protein n=1 Tax=Rhizophagus irregularis TaxID=588596 RepID=A0A2N1MRM9_9GLOM|nr:hypothetical protein RhiirC2_787785 [Rhizophagus irregularis]